MNPAALDARIGHAFGNAQLRQQALTHRSYGTPNNERLEFLGDSVLNFATAVALFERFPALKEGELSRLRAGLVNQQVLFEVAESLGLGDALLLGEGELKSGGHRRPSILADALEALIGAVFLDAGFDAARSVVNRLLQSRLAEIDPRNSGKDAKTQLQERLQAGRLALPTYEVLAVRGEAHQQQFRVKCSVPALDLACEGEGPSRRAAEQQAAVLVLERLDRDG